MVFMNVGQRRPPALTVMTLKRHERTFAAARPQPDRLATHRLRVRGRNKERLDPRFEANGPERTEIAEGK
jgi:hypothetical protein